MNITKLKGHTPKPWYEGRGPDIDSCIYGDGKLVCSVDCGDEDLEIPQRERDDNKKAIAYLSDLLELAKLGLKLAERVDKCSRDGGCEACGKLARALQEKVAKL